MVREMEDKMKCFYIAVAADSIRKMSLSVTMFEDKKPERKVRCNYEI